MVDASLNSDMQRANLLRGISTATLGSFGNTVLSILISLACFTTAVGITIGTADYFKGLFKESKLAYVVTAIIACVFGVAVGQMDFHSIIVIALPVLMFIYPLTIVLIFLNVVPEKYGSSQVFRVVTLTTFVFSIPDILGYILPSGSLDGIKELIPLSSHHMGWVLPALAVFIVVNVFQKFTTKDG